MINGDYGDIGEIIGDFLQIVFPIKINIIYVCPVRWEPNKSHEI